jgi:hypothetical protein
LSNSYPKAHAIHNAKVCAFLNDANDYPDWVVTTAFYAALHFVQHEVFPGSMGNRTYVSFENYYNGHYGHTQNKPNRHRSTINLVYSEIGTDAGVIYEWLHDACRTARYRNFNTSPSVAKASMERLEELRTYFAK